MTTTNTRSAMKFRKRPIVIEAILWNGNNLRDVIEFTNGPPNLRTQHARMRWDDYESLVQDSGLRIYTLEGAMLANVGDMIVRGVQGELYPCKPDIFAATYDPVDPTLIEAATAEQANPVDADELCSVIDRLKRYGVSDSADMADNIAAFVGRHFRNEAFIASLRPSSPEQGAVGREEIESALSAAIAPYIEHLGKRLKSGGFPMEDGALISWSSWIAHRQIDAVMHAIPAIRPSASAGGESVTLRAAAERLAHCTPVVVAFGDQQEPMGCCDCPRCDLLRALTPSPAVPEVDGAAQEMLVAFAEGVEWTDEKRAAYDALNRALSVVPEVAK